MYGYDSIVKPLKLIGTLYQFHMVIHYMDMPFIIGLNKYKKLLILEMDK